MRVIFGLVLLFGMGLAGFAVYMVNQYMDSQTAALEQAQQLAATAPVTVEVYAVARSLTYGDQLTKDDVRVIPYVQDALPEGSFATEEELFPMGVDVPRIVVLPMLENEVIMASKVTEPGVSRGLTALVAPGYRAFPVQGRMAAGFGTLRPDDRIDVYWTGRLRDGREVTNLIKSGLQIIAIIGDSSAPENVVVQVTPEEVALLTQAQNSGMLTLSLVGTGDVTETGPVTVDNSALTGEGDVVAPELPVVEEEARRCFVVQRSGTTRAEVEVECSE
ncbi:MULTISPECIES: Flp pilus assembly protein CpaB [unclassified Yoonia]|uniref:Flp pilus assembly protein CpaB n=1 Tax=unclassified Yoonia TaxID=2629118 RepID=UPI002AFDF94D|nr:MULTISPECIES: Flp pilus assembly protein CpaB [unclassified Yoonia]